MADTNNTNTTGGSMWGGIWDAAGSIGSAAVTALISKGNTTPGATAAGVPAATTVTTPDTGSSNKTILYIVGGIVAVAALMFGVKLLKK